MEGRNMVREGLTQRLALRRVLVFLFLLWISVWLSGCFLISANYKMGDTIDQESTKNIHPGKTVKQEILQWFGPPIAVARKGELVKIPRLGANRTGWDEIQSDTFFELFSSKQPLTENHIVYYYHSAEDKSTAGMFVVYAHGEGKLSVNKLWILIDDKTGLVADFLFRPE